MVCAPLPIHRSFKKLLIMFRGFGVFIIDEVAVDMMVLWPAFLLAALVDNHGTASTADDSVEFY